MRLQYAGRWWGLGAIGSGVLLVLLMTMMLFPICNNEALATDEIPQAEGNASNEPFTISVSVPPRIDIDITPTTEGTSTSGTGTLHVSTNSEDGYRVYLYSANGKNTLNGSNDNTATIGATSSWTSFSKLENNTWGYALHTYSSVTDSTTFSPIPISNSSPIYTSSNIGSPSDDTLYLKFAMKVDTAIPSDQYSASVVLAIVANPIRYHALSQITYMQEMQTGDCKKTQVGDTKQLIDSRDGKKYWVAKMKDGNCWMTQDLALDLTTEGLSVDDTDIKTNWDNSSRNPPLETQYAGSSTKSGSWNITLPGGQWVNGAPTQEKDCGWHKTDIEGCTTKYGVVKVDDTWSPTFEGKDMVFNVPGSDYYGQTLYSAVDYEKKEYDAHYLIGNSYYWYTAMAGTADDSIYNDSDASGSICPKGWRLPSNRGGDFTRLFSKYGLSNSVEGTSAGITYHVNKLPLAFTRGGSAGSQGLSYVGGTGYYWTATAQDTFQSNGFRGVSMAYYMKIRNYGGLLDPAGSYSSVSLADSVRCLVR